MTATETARTFEPDPNKVLFWLMKMRRVGDGEMAEHLGLSRQAVYHKRARGAAIRAKELGLIAEVLGVPVELFYGPPSAAIQWLAQNEPEFFNGAADGSVAGEPSRRIAQFRCTVPSRTRYVRTDAINRTSTLKVYGHRFQGIPLRSGKMAVAQVG